MNRYATIPKDGEYIVEVEGGIVNNPRDWKESGDVAEKAQKYERIKRFIEELCYSEKFCDECIFINEDGFCLQDCM